MSEQNVTTQPQEVSAPEFNPFAQQSWSENAPEGAPAGEETRTPETTAAPAAATETTPPAETAPPAAAVDYNAYLKEKFGWDSEEVAAQQLAELKEKAKGKEFANDYSRQMYEYLLEGKEDDLYSHLSQKKQVEKLLSADVTDERTAAEMVKFGIKSKNNDLTSDEVEFLFNKRFGIPKEPTRLNTETDEEFDARKNEWAAQVNAVKKEMIIEAKLAKPEIEKLKNELVLPKIGGEGQPQLTQEDLQRLEENQKRFIQKVDAEFKNFNGFEVKYKDEEVEIPVTFGYDEAQKAALKEELKTFDVDVFFDQRWFSNGEPNVVKIMQDISLLKDGEAVMQKIANEVGAQVLKHYRKTTSNVSVTGGQPSTTTTSPQAVNPFADASWSMTPAPVN